MERRKSQTREVRWGGGVNGVDKQTVMQRGKWKAGGRMMDETIK